MKDLFEDEHYRDLLFEVLSFLGPKELLIVALVCKNTVDVTSENQIWKPFLQPEKLKQAGNFKLQFFANPLDRKPKYPPKKMTGTSRSTINYPRLV